MINEDNQAAISVARDPKDHPKTKHIAFKHYFITDKISNKEIDMKYCPADVMLADIFTEGLPAAKFTNLRLLCDIISYSQYMSCEKEC